MSAPEPAPAARGGGGPAGWMDMIARYGFTMVFAAVALGYGLYFGQQMLKEQRATTVALVQIADYGAQMTQQMAAIEDRLERIEVRMAVAAGSAPPVPPP